MITFDVPNIDCAAIDPAELENLALVFASLADYTSIKAHAMRRRLAGNIVGALQLEHTCETIYEQLPDWAKW